MELHTRLTMVNGAAYEGYHGVIELYMRVTIVNGAVYEAYHGLCGCI